jgi:hypothetical protein
MSEQERPFNVSDRRHFTPEGEPREREVIERAAPLAAPEGAAGPSAEQRARLDLVWLFVSLASQAHALLGLTPSEAAEPQPDLAGAKALIGLIETLEDRTSGRRTPEEDQVLDSVLFELRMAFVARSRGEGM